MTYAALLKWAARELDDVGIEGARREAELLLAYILGIRREDLYLMNPQTEVGANLRANAASDAATATVTARFQEVVARRAAREPLAYITGVKEFYGLTFAVDQRVLIPRPETELLVELCLEHLERVEHLERLERLEHLERLERRSGELSREQSQPYVVADICTGSGAVGIAVAVNRPDVSILASDISAAALEVAADNARRHGVSERIILAQGDLFDPWQSSTLSPSPPSSQSPPPNAAGRLLDRATNRTIDVILCNPPYIPQDVIAALQPEIRDYEPRQALEAGVDGLSFYRRLFSQAGAFLNQNGLLLAEIGDGQQNAVLCIAQENGWNASTVPDLAGIARVVIAKRV